MRILFDTSIVLDVLLKREPFVAEASALWEANDNAELTGCINATTLTNIFYIARRQAGLGLAREAIRTCLEAFEICEVNRQVLERAQEMSGNDFEDNVQIASAELAGVDGIVTRDKTGFQETSVSVFTPGEFLELLTSTKR